MFIVTGGCGMVGSNLIARLNRAGIDDIMVVDSLQNGHKFKNIADLRIADYEDRDDFLTRVEQNRLPPLDGIFHQGALTNTMVHDGRLMMAMNYSYSRYMLALALKARVPLVYASSAAVYGLSAHSAEEPANEVPLNVYGYSKKLFDDLVRRTALGSDMPPVVGLRYFNVYGPREGHKGAMSSVAHRLYQRISRGETAAIFGGHDGIGPGEHRRDFIHVDDVVSVIDWAFGSGTRGIFNCGTGESPRFIDLANAVIEVMGRGVVEFLPFPEALVGRYQSGTRADLDNLRAAGCPVSFRGLKTGITEYIAWLNRHEP